MLQHGGSSSLRLLLDEVTSPAAAAAGTAAAVPSPTPEASNGIKWTAATVFWTLGVFLLAGLAGRAHAVDRGTWEGLFVRYVIAGETPAASMRRLGRNALGAKVERETAAMRFTSAIN